MPASPSCSRSTSRFAIASTLKLVHGLAASAVVIDRNREDLLDGAGDLADKSTTEGDADIGIMARFGQFRAGLTVRNVTEPDFETPDGGEIELAAPDACGYRVLRPPGVHVRGRHRPRTRRGAARRRPEPGGGVEARLHPRVAARTGFRMNTLSTNLAATHRLLGGRQLRRFRAMFVDGQVTLGSEAADRGWGIAARLVY